MKQVSVSERNVQVQQGPAPQVSPKNILVRVVHSRINAGRETAGVRMSALPLYRRALNQPHQVKRDLHVMRKQGFKRTFDRVPSQLKAALPPGYSAAGVVAQVGSEVEELAIGNLAACARAGVADYAEVIDVPV